MNPSSQTAVDALGCHLIVGNLHELQAHLPSAKKICTAYCLGPSCLLRKYTPLFILNCITAVLACLSCIFSTNWQIGNQMNLSILTIDAQKWLVKLTNYFWKVGLQSESWFVTLAVFIVQNCKIWITLMSCILFQVSTLPWGVFGTYHTYKHTDMSLLLVIDCLWQMNCVSAWLSFTVSIWMVPLRSSSVCLIAMCESRALSSHGWNLHDISDSWAFHFSMFKQCDILYCIS